MGICLFNTQDMPVLCACLKPGLLALETLGRLTPEFLCLPGINVLAIYNNSV